MFPLGLLLHKNTGAIGVDADASPPFILPSFAVGTRFYPAGVRGGVCADFRALRLGSATGPQWRRPLSLTRRACPRPDRGRESRMLRWFPGPLPASGGSVKSKGLGDGAKPGEPSSAYEAQKSAIAKLALDAATRMPGCFHRHCAESQAENRWRQCRCLFSWTRPGSMRR